MDSVIPAVSRNWRSANRLANREEQAGLLAGQFHGLSADVPAFNVAGKEPVPGFLRAPPLTQDLPQFL